MSAETPVINNRICGIYQIPFYNPEFCEALINLSEEKEVWEPAELERGVKKDESRKTFICEAGKLDPTGEILVPPIKDLLHTIYDLNKNSWNFSLYSDLLETTFLKYMTGDHYSAWHTDISNEASLRKISFSIQLSKEDDYEGGALQFLNNDIPTIRNQGSVIIFPSFLAHRVSEITKGTRYAVIGFISGPPFK